MCVCGSHSLEMLIIHQAYRLWPRRWAPLVHIKDITRFIKNPYCCKLSLGGGEFHVCVWTDHHLNSMRFSISTGQFHRWGKRFFNVCTAHNQRSAWGMCVSQTAHGLLLNNDLLEHLCKSTNYSNMEQKVDFIITKEIPSLFFGFVLRVSYWR